MAESQPALPFQSRNLRAALEYARRGFQVFPVAGKIPATPHGFKDASLDPAQIARWWSGPEGHGIGLPTGAVNGVLVLDVDPRNGGDESLAALIREHGPFPDTPVQRTGGGGRHYFFSYPGGTINCSHPWLGLDIKANGGYVVVPFSRHPSGGTYEWEPGHALGTIPLAPPPAWLLNPPKADASEAIKALDSTIWFPKGTRGVSLLSLAGTMRRCGMEPEAIFAALMVENEIKCKPPVPEYRVRGIITSIARYTPGDPVRPDVPAPETEFARRSLKGVLDPAAGRVTYLVEGLIPKGDLTLMAASWKSGKTLLAYRLALDAARGVPFLGQFAIDHPIPTAIFQQEMPFHEDERRFRRLGLGAGMSPEEIVALGESTLFHYNRLPIFLGDRQGAARFHAMVLDQGIELVLIDSLLANFAGTNLNDNSESRLAFSLAFNPLTSRGVTILLLHHYKKIQATDNGLDQRSLVLGAQAWAAASGRIYALEPVPIERTPVAPGTFRVRLSSLGSWTPGESATLVEVRDDGEGTTIEVMESNDEATRFARISTLLVTLVRERKSIRRKDAFAAVSQALFPDICPARTFERAVTRAVGQKLIESTRTKTTPSEAIFTPVPPEP